MDTESNKAAKSGRVLLALNAAIPLAWAAWVYFSLSRPAIWYGIAAASFISILFVRSGFRYSARVKGGKGESTFREYISRRNVLLQNAAAGSLMGVSGFVAGLILGVVHAIGGLPALIIFDAIISTVIVMTFYRRPGTRRTLSRSFHVNDENQHMVNELADSLSVTRPELRLLPSSGSGRVNASSWNLPGGKNYIFADEELFSQLETEEIRAILTHEMGHLRYRHSSRSYLLSTFIPLTWINAIFAPFIFIHGIAVLALPAAVVVITALYLKYWRGAFSRRLERQADIFAARNCDKDNLISSLRKLFELNNLDGMNHRGSTHLTMEEREKVIRKA